MILTTVLRSIFLASGFHFLWFAKALIGRSGSIGGNQRPADDDTLDTMPGPGGGYSAETSLRSRCHMLQCVNWVRSFRLRLLGLPVLQVIVTRYVHTAYFCAFRMFGYKFAPVDYFYFLISI